MTHTTQAHIHESDPPFDDDRSDGVESYAELRVTARQGSKRLLRALKRVHGKIPKAAVKVEIAAEDPRIKLLEAENEELHNIIRMHRRTIVQLRDAAMLDTPRFSEIIDAVATFYNITITNIIGKNRRPQFELPRQVVAYLTKAHSDLSLRQIGERLGGRDHATIHHSIKKISAQMEGDEILRDDLDVLMIKIEDKILARQALAETSA